ncbi:MAG: tyrosine-type recombinase/integrase, partial [Actinomycetota bacterium]|nr:tyrosine-type recombinase/integrase [Actinomycetota bacterium]
SNQRMSNSMVREMLVRNAVRAGVEKRVHPHGLRHTMAHELLMEGVPIPIIQRQLGHASLQTTDIYLSHIAPKQVIEVMSARSWDAP